MITPQDQHQSTEPVQPEKPQSINKTTETNVLISDKPISDQQDANSIPSSQPSKNKQQATRAKTQPITHSPAKAKKNKPVVSDKTSSPTDSLQPPIDLKSEVNRLETPWRTQQPVDDKGYRTKRFKAVSSWHEPGAQYKEAWRRKVERIGNMNYPEEARKKEIYGKLKMSVSINRNGSLHKIKITRSSGYLILDKAAISIVKLAAPFAPFGNDLNDYDRIEIIRTWVFEQDSYFSF